MRQDFFVYLYELMQQNPDIWAITGDLGYGGFDRIREDFPKRFINTGAAEIAMMDIAVGLALEGKTPIVYSITPFLLYRPFEVIRTYINHESIPVIMVGSGRGKDYVHDGFSHDASDDLTFMQHFRNILPVHPSSNQEMRDELTKAIEKKVPAYFNLKR